MKPFIIAKIIKPLHNCYKKLSVNFSILVYKTKGRKPWSTGYNEYKWQSINKHIHDWKIVSMFRDQSSLPKNYGVGIDERIVEYPWIISNIDQKSTNLLDAGSALNFLNILEHEVFTDKKITIANLNPESRCYWEKEISYIFEDIRDLPLKDGLFDTITCISTLEHVGMDNTAMYTGNNKYRENEKGDYLKVITELKRLLKQNGKLLITVPFGEYQNFGFFQQFDASMIQNIINIFGSGNYSLNYYKYTDKGWQLSDEKESSHEKYFNIHEDKSIPSDMAAAARSVACIKLIK